MDTVTQIALGASLGEATLGRQAGRRAALWGGLCGLFPDLDVLIPFGDAVRTFTYHRGFSHSIFVLTALTPLFVGLILKFHPRTAAYRSRWTVLVFLALVTHILLDGLTVYGTQILWPLPTPPVMWSTIFIIDPAYSIPLFTGVLAALFLSRRRGRGHGVNALCLVLSSLYLVWSIGVKLHVNETARDSLDARGIRYEHLLTVPSPFNTLLWRVLVMDDSGYYEGFYSLLDGDRTIRFEHYESDDGLLDELAGHWPVRRLRWFTHGFYSVRQIDRAIVVTDLRMGLEPYYVFQFQVGRVEPSRILPVKSARVVGERGLERLAWVWRRIRGPVEHPPGGASGS